jgi:hypothetical protein
MKDREQLYRAAPRVTILEGKSATQNKMGARRG